MLGSTSSSTGGGHRVVQLANARSLGDAPLMQSPPQSLMVIAPAITYSISRLGDEAHFLRNVLMPNPLAPTPPTCLLPIDVGGNTPLLSPSGMRERRSHKISLPTPALDAPPIP